MKKIIQHTITSEDLTGTAQGVVSLVLKRIMHLSAHEISSAKFTHDGITADGIQVTVKDRVKKDQLLSICLEDTADMTDHLLPVHGDPGIIYEDEDLLAVNKPAGIVVHPTHGHYSDSIANIIAGYYTEKNENVIIRAFGRLDKDTSGVLLFAKNKAAAGRLEHQRERGQYCRTYYALVHGTLENKIGIIDAPLSPVPGTLMRQCVSDDGRPAVTHYEVLWSGDNGALKYSVLRLHLDTGRTHQIRVHMAYIGHPLLGDPIYGDTAVNDDPASEHAYDFAPLSAHSGRSHALFTHTALHAGCIDLKQPFTGLPLHISAPFPSDIAEFLDMEDTLS